MTIQLGSEIPFLDVLIIRKRMILAIKFYRDSPHTHTH
jgi:hypothetical protein